MDDPKPIANILSNIKMTKYTPEQDALIEEASHGSGNITGRARAGSGKTFILKAIASCFPNKRILYVTFSKLLVDEAKAAGLPSNVNIQTAHGVAYRAAKAYYCPSGKLDVKEYFREQKLFEYLNHPEFDCDTGSPEEDSWARENRKTFLDLIKYSKLNMASTPEQVLEVCQYYGISAEEWMIELMDKARAWSLKPSSQIDFVEMVHTPVSLNLPMQQYDVILADEVQDSSLMLMNLYKQCLAPGGRIVCVGDDKQAIFGFAGSRNEALDMFTEFFGCKTMPLSVNFRCGRQHIELAQTIVPDIMAHENAIEGEIIRTDDPKLEGLKYGDLIICRRVAPLVGPCLSLVKQGQKAIIKGRDIAGPILTILKKVKNKSKKAALDKIIDMEEDDIALAEKRKYKKASVDAITERYAVAKSFLMEEDSVEAAMSRIEDIFSDEIDGIVFSSIHKSKGLEAKNVVLLQAQQVRINRPDMLKWQHEQEANLEYVAYTRAKEKLTLMYSKETGTEKEADEE